MSRSNKNQMENELYIVYKDVNERLNRATKEYLELKFNCKQERELENKLSELEKEIDKLKKDSEKAGKKSDKTLEERIERLENKIEDNLKKAQYSLKVLSNNEIKNRTKKKLKSKSLDQNEKEMKIKEKIEINEQVKNELEKLKKEKEELIKQQEEAEEGLKKYYLNKSIVGKNDLSGNRFCNCYYQYLGMTKGSIREEINNTYIKDPTEEEIMKTEKIKLQEEVIKNLTLLIIIENRLAHDSDDKNKEHYKVKHKTMEELITALYIRENICEEEQKNKYSYGIIKDEKDEDIFCIDSPGIGQVVVHFGSDENKNKVLKNAHRKVKRILENTPKLDKIRKEELRKLGEDANNIIPEYTGYHFEKFTSMPILKKIDKEELKRLREENRISERDYRILKALEKLEMPILKEDCKQKIKQLAENGNINLREYYTLAVIGGFGKKELEQIANKTREHTKNKTILKNKARGNINREEKVPKTERRRVDVQVIGETCLNETDIIEREEVSKHEERKIIIDRKENIGIRA